MSTVTNALWRWPTIFVLAVLWAFAALVSFALGSVASGASRAAEWALDRISDLNG